MITMALLIAALILFILAALPVPSRISLGWAGMACLALYWLIT